MCLYMVHFDLEPLSTWVYYKSKPKLLKIVKFDTKSEKLVLEFYEAPLEERRHSFTSWRVPYIKWQTHKIDYMPFATVIKSIFCQKKIIISAIHKENRLFNIKIVFKTRD